MNQSVYREPCMKLFLTAGEQISRRNVTVDVVRTLAIVLMVIFHFIYDLRFFNWVTWNIPNGDGWKHFRYVILTLFFLCFGVGLVYSHAKKFNLSHFLLRLLKVSVGALLVTLMSLVMYPSSWVYFGVLHFIAVASILSIILIPYPRFALLAGVSVIALTNLGYLSIKWPFDYILNYLPNYTTDYVPIFPWVGVVWLGIALGHTRMLNADVLKNIKHREGLSYPGKHSLIIYLVHQPIMFLFLYPLSLFTRH